MASIQRRYSTLLPISPTRVTINSRSYLQFCSTSYLSLQWNTRVQNEIKLLLKNLSPSHFSSLSSNFLGGTHPSKINLEKTIANTLGYNTCIAFSSGWCANYAIAQFVSKSFDIVFSDNKNHNSFIEGLNKTSLNVSIIDINNLNDEIINNNKGKKIAVVYPSIEGISGLTSRLNISLESRKLITIIVDEAHSFGLFGDNGYSLIQEIDADIRIISFSKALGHIGSAICCNNDTRTWIEQNASTWIFTTPLPPYLWEINLLLFLNLPLFNNERAILFENCDFLRKQLTVNNISYSGALHIISLEIPDIIDPHKFEDYFEHLGIFLKVSGFPTVTKGIMMSRMSVNAFHKREEILMLVDAIENGFKNKKLHYK